MDTLQLVADPRRRAILEMVWDDELAAGDIAARFDVSFGAVSQHLRRLREAGLVAVRKDGNRRLYRAEVASMGPLRDVLQAMWADRLDSLATAAESET